MNTSTVMNDLQGLLQNYAAEAQGLPQPPAQAEGTAAPNFGNLFAQALNNVNDVQLNAGGLAQAFEMGEQGVDLSDVMIANQKAGLAFQATVQVRNRIVEAYQEVMNMPV